jgi:hypothetical protein
MVSIPIIHENILNDFISLLYLNINWEVEDIDKIILISNLFSLLKS